MRRVGFLRLGAGAAIAGGGAAGSLRSATDSPRPNRPSAYATAIRLDSVDHTTAVVSTAGMMLQSPS
ncbi:hypothetical protein JNW90_00770 [Micromonospora sp. STR1s_5]|nr:hypothetical protein [Micromonospora sp. STR1s_5]